MGSFIENHLGIVIYGDIFLQILYPGTCLYLYEHFSISNSHITILLFGQSIMDKERLGGGLKILFFECTDFMDGPLYTFDN